MPTTGRGGTNRFINPSLEVDTAGWTQGVNNSTLTRSADLAWVGSSSGKIVIAAHQYSCIYPTWDFAGLTPLTGVAHIFHGRVRVWIPLGTTVARIFLNVLYSDANQAQSPIFENTVGTGAWQDLVIPPVVSDPTKTLQSVALIMGNYGTSANAYEFYVDGADLRIDEPDVDTYIDGDQGDRYAWTDTPHASTSVRAPGYMVGAGVQAAGSQSVTLLPKAARSAADSSLFLPSLPVKGADSIRFDFDLVSITSGNVGLKLEAWDPARLLWVALLDGPLLSAPGHQTLAIDPRLPPVANLTVQQIPPARLRARLTGTAEGAVSSLTATAGQAQSDFTRVQTFVVFPMLARVSPDIFQTWVPLDTAGASAIRFDLDAEAFVGTNLTIVIQSWDPAKQAWLAHEFVGEGRLTGPGHAVTTIDPRVPPSLSNSQRELPSKLQVRFGGNMTSATCALSCTLGA
jgi:hypothetical protein